MPIFEIQPDRLMPLQTVALNGVRVRERDDLQRLLRDQIEVLEDGLLLISEEFCDWDVSRRRIDLLALDRQANLVVVELKRDDTGGHMELQALRYAAMVSTMTFERAVGILGAYRQRRGLNDDP